MAGINGKHARDWYEVQAAIAKLRSDGPSKTPRPAYVFNHKLVPETYETDEQFEARIADAAARLITEFHQRWAPPAIPRGLT